MDLAALDKAVAATRSSLQPSNGQYYVFVHPSITRWLRTGKWARIEYLKRRHRPFGRQR